MHLVHCAQGICFNQNEYVRAIEEIHVVEKQYLHGGIPIILFNVCLYSTLLDSTRPLTSKHRIARMSKVATQHSRNPSHSVVNLARIRFPLDTSLAKSIPLTFLLQTESRPYKGGLIQHRKSTSVHFWQSNVQNLPISLAKIDAMGCLIKEERGLINETHIPSLNNSTSKTNL